MQLVSSLVRLYGLIVLSISKCALCPPNSFLLSVQVPFAELRSGLPWLIWNILMYGTTNLLSQRRSTLQSATGRSCCPVGTNERLLHEFDIFTQISRPRKTCFTPEVYIYIDPVGGRGDKRVLCSHTHENIPAS